jgi:hypothetical protein
MMSVGVLGGGLQGCCIALALAERKVRVTIFDKNDTLLSRAAIANEGKIHLGYMYAGDRTLATAKIMMAGALAFAPFLERYLGQPAQSFSLSASATYVVHRDSHRCAEDVRAYLTVVHDLINEAAAGRKRAYFGKNLQAPLRRWSAAARAAEFDQELALDAVSTPEIAINPVILAKAIRECIASHPLIEVRCGRTVLGVEMERSRLFVLSEGQDVYSRDSFDSVVNALWDGRLRLDEALGFRAIRPWLHRLKYGVSFQLPPGVRPPPSATFVLGPFGEVVSYENRITYLTWYPECLKAICTAVAPPDWVTYPTEPLRSRIIAGTLNGLREIVLTLRGLGVNSLPEAVVKGGAIVAWGKTDIYDPACELHRRFEIGVTSQGRYHSVDPGKLTMAPYFAQICAERINPHG